MRWDQMAGGPLGTPPAETQESNPACRQPTAAERLLALLRSQYGPAQGREAEAQVCVRSCVTLCCFLASSHSSLESWSRLRACSANGGCRCMHSRKTADRSIYVAMLYQCNIASRHSPHRTVWNFFTHVSDTIPRQFLGLLKSRQHRGEGGANMPVLLGDLLLFFCLAAWVTGIVIAIANLLN